MNTAEIYDLLLKVYEAQGRHSERMDDLDKGIGEAIGIASRLDRTLRGSNGDPGALGRISILEEEMEKVATAEDVADLRARLSERCKADAVSVARSGHRWGFWATVAAAVIVVIGGPVAGCEIGKAYGNASAAEAAPAPSVVR